MPTINEILAQAVDDGVIAPDQKEKLAPYFHIEAGDPANGEKKPSELAELLAYEPVNPVEDSEMPRFVRGFHDVLITIGVLTGVFGIWGFGGAYSAIVIILILSELLVRRQRLALPAVVLTVLLCSAIVSVLNQHLMVAEPKSILWQFYFDYDALTAFLYVLPFPFILGFYYRRYGVPLALAGAVLTGGSTILASVLLIMSAGMRQPHFFDHNPKILILMIFFTAVAIFMRAVRMDFRDPQRLTRRSDVAFWLHLMTAPILLHATLALVFMNDISVLWKYGDIDVLQSVIVLIIVASFMKIGLLLDRRAFVTSGLGSLAFAIWTLFERSDFTSINVYYVVLIVIGALVLGLGVGWPHIRRFMFRFIPVFISQKLPPLR